MDNKDLMSPVALTVAGNYQTDGRASLHLQYHRKHTVLHNQYLIRNLYQQPLSYAVQTKDIYQIKEQKAVNTAVFTHNYI